jgi:endo-beta-N-acetylglucosaminidase D
MADVHSGTPKPDEVFAGIDTGARQYGIQGSMDEIFPGKDESGLSVALYRPDFTLTGTGDPSRYPAREKGDSGVRYDVEALHDDGARDWFGASTGGAFYVARVAGGVHQLAVAGLAADGRRGPEGTISISSW